MGERGDCRVEHGRDDLHEPPADPKQCARYRLEYVVTKLKEEIKEFDQFRARINEQITLASKYSNHFYPNPEALDLLEQGKRRIEKLSARKVELEELLRDPERERKEQLRREEEERERQRRSEFIARLNSISV